MGLFDKKFCDICGEKIGLLGNRKLEDGNLCKNCAAKLSPWFSERRASTVQQIQEQLNYREDNRASVEVFHTTSSYGQVKKLLLDENNEKFMVASTHNYAQENPDVLDFSQVTGCDMDIRESRTEQKMKDAQGNYVSYNPARYTYHYDFYFSIHVNHPYFDEMEFKLNSSSIDVDPNTTTYVNGGRANTGFGAARMTPPPAAPRPAQPAAARPNMGPGINKAVTAGRPNMGGAVGAARNVPGAPNRPNAVPASTQRPAAAPRPSMPVSSMVTTGNAQAMAQQNPQYQNFVAMGEEIKAKLSQIHEAAVYETAQPKVPVKCPYCGGSDLPDDNGCCSFCGSALNGVV